MSDYTQSTFFAPKDLLATGNPNKIIYGSDVDAELSAISTAIATKADVNGDAIGAGTPCTELSVDNLKLDGNKITSTNTDGDIELEPDGTGSVVITKVDIADGEIDGTPIGANSASTGAFTTLTASGDVNFDSGTFFVDASADAVGIGTNNPSNLLTVNSTAGAGIKVYGADQAHARIAIDNLNGQEWNIVAGTVGVSNSGFGIYDADAGAIRLQIDASGNVGIGVTPTAKLHVSGTIQSQTGSSVAQMYSDGGAAFFTSVGAYPSIFSTNGTERMRIDASGNLGVGTASPASKLSIAAGDILLDNTRSIIFKDNGGVARGILQYFSDNSTYLDAPNGNTVFRNGTSNTEKMRITSGGNVGIGSPGPVSRLEVVNSGVAALYVGYNNTSENYYDANTHYFRNGAGTTERARIDSSGNLGVGTASPARTLHVNDVMRLEPRATAPSSPSAGDIFFNSSTNKLQCYDGTAWQDCF